MNLNQVSKAELFCDWPNLDHPGGDGFDEAALARLEDAIREAEWFDINRIEPARLEAYLTEYSKPSVGGSTTPAKQAVYTSHQGNNAQLMREIANLYFEPGMSIADVTYGKGVFWRQIDISQYQFCPSDLITCPGAAFDFRKLPYGNHSLNIVVFDPPYTHDPGKMFFERNYQNRATTRGFRHANIIDLYRDGMTEAHRVLKPKGLLLVKCKDEIESSKQQMQALAYTYMITRGISVILSLRAYAKV